MTPVLFTFLLFAWLGILGSLIICISFMDCLFPLIRTNYYITHALYSYSGSSKTIGLVSKGVVRLVKPLALR